MKIVTDTNVFLAVALDQPERFRLASLCRGHQLIAPHVLPFEIGNALSALAKRQLIARDDVVAAWQSIQEVPVELRTIDIQNALGLAMRFKTYAYDAYFLECAQSSGAPLLTLDKSMKRTAKLLGLEILE